MLQWAAINNWHALCKYLLAVGADVNARGGQSMATPAMWAAKKGHYYVVSLLLQNGADLLVTDVQGYTILHLATFEGYMFLLVLLLHQNIPVDVVDPQGHSCLMWAAYMGYPACVDLFLRWGANVNATDETGFTALHWALVNGSQACVQKLIEYGSDRFARTHDGKTPAAFAAERNISGVWHRALADCGYKEDGSPKFSAAGTTYIRLKALLPHGFYFMPFLMIWAVGMILAHMLIYYAVPLAVLVTYSLQWLVNRLLRIAPPEMKHLHRTVSLQVPFLWLAPLKVLIFGKALPSRDILGVVFLGRRAMVHGYSSKYVLSARLF